MQNHFNRLRKEYEPSALLLNGNNPPNNSFCSIRLFAVQQSHAHRGANLCIFICIPRPLEQFFTGTEYYTTPAGVRLWQKKKKRHLEKLSLNRSGKENGMCQFTSNTSNRHILFALFSMLL